MWEFQKKEFIPLERIFNTPPRSLALLARSAGCWCTGLERGLAGYVNGVRERSERGEIFGFCGCWRAIWSGLGGE